MKILFQILTRVWYVIRIWGEYQWDLLPLQIQPLSIQDSCQNPQTKDTLLRSYFWLIVCKYPYFSQKLRKHCLVQNADVGKQNPPTLMASEIAVIRKPDFMDPMNLFPSDAKVTCTCQHDCIYKYVWWRFRRSYVKLIMLLDRRNWKKYIVVFRTLKRVVMTYHFFGRWPDLYGVTIPC